jgi:hypothetical protein
MNLYKYVMNGGLNNLIKKHVIIVGIVVFLVAIPLVRL